mmetsp:Transcript_8134/g.19843  ORF Transcript_8134/g.19843 Transcript_8134/m.19843 type:complete len:235 (-) Transcript_8134:303-1007(-)
MESHTVESVAPTSTSRAGLSKVVVGRAGGSHSPSRICWSSRRWSRSPRFLTLSSPSATWRSSMRSSFCSRTTIPRSVSLSFSPSVVGELRPLLRIPADLGLLGASWPPPSWTGGTGRCCEIGTNLSSTTASVVCHVSAEPLALAGSIVAARSVRLSRCASFRRSSSRAPSGVSLTARPDGPQCCSVGVEGAVRALAGIARLSEPHWNSPHAPAALAPSAPKAAECARLGYSKTD